MSQQSDLTFLRTFTSNDPGKMSKYINMFLKGAEPTLEQMKSQIEQSDWSALKTSSHSLKSQLKYMGVNAGVDLAFSIETNSGEGKNLDSMPETLTKLQEIVVAACNELRDELTKL